MLMVVTRDRVVAGSLTQKTHKVSHFEEELWIKMANPHISWLTWTWRKFKPPATCGHPCRPLQNVFWKTVGTLDEWNPTTKCQRGKFMLSCCFFQSFLSTLDACHFVAFILNCYRCCSELCGACCSCKDGTNPCNLFVLQNQVHFVLYLSKWGNYIPPFNGWGCKPL